MQMIWSAAQGDVSPPTPATTTTSAPPPSPPQSLHLSLPFSPFASGEMLSALPAAFVQKVIYFSCCSPSCYFSVCRIGWRGRGWLGGGRRIRRWGLGVGEPAASPVQMNNCHLPFAGPCCWRKSFPYFVKGLIEIRAAEMAAASRYRRAKHIPALPQCLPTSRHVTAAIRICRVSTSRQNKIFLHHFLFLKTRFSISWTPPLNQPVGWMYESKSAIKSSNSPGGWD